jgi:hypothetical protein
MQEANRLNIVGRLTVAGAVVAALAAGALSFGVSSSMDQAGGRRNSVVQTSSDQAHVIVLAGGGRRTVDK